MRELEFTLIGKFSGTRIEYSNVNNPSPEYYERVSSVITRYGIVSVYECDWMTNKGKTVFTLFKTTMGEMYFEAQLKEARLSDQQLKWLSTNFMNQLIDKHLR